MRSGISCYPDLDYKAAEWLQKQRQNCYIITINTIKACALKCVNSEQRKEFISKIGW